MTRLAEPPPLDQPDLGGGGASGSAAAPALADSPAYRPVAAWCSVGILLIFSLFSFLDRQIIALLVDPIKQDLGLTDTQLGLLQGLAFALLYAVAGLPIGWAVDRYPRRIILFAGIAIWSVASASCGLARNFWQMFIGRTFVGVGEASMGPTAVSLISDLFPRDRVATPLGVYSAGFYIGGGVALTVGGWVVSLFSGQPVVDLPIIGATAPWQAVLIATGLPGVIVAFLAFAIYEPRSPEHLRRIRSRPAQASVAAFLRGRWRLVSLAYGGFGIAAFVSYAITAWTPTYFIRVFKWSATDVGWTYGLIVGLSGASGAFLGGVLMDRIYRGGRTDAYFLVAGIASLIATPLFAGAFFVASPNVALMMLSGGLVMFGTISAASYSTWQKIAPPAVRGRVTATYILIGAIVGSGLGPLSTGLVTDYVMRDPLAVGYSIALISGLSFPVMALLFLTGRGQMRALTD
ncbi:MULTISPECIES: spinster family MFS transporter [unclassified Sphingomonas]|uniref:spinster family MFS transporter n=1 Tax=unclassified Sphingomonas TaxID=196159 RepID=UPI0009EA379E|nr:MULTISPECIES: MFS transporter [unclassified Sphingomonas]